MRRIDGYLSRMAQTVLPDAIVFDDDKVEPGYRYSLERPGQCFALGDTFKDAKRAIKAWCEAIKARAANLEKP